MVRVHHRIKVRPLGRRDQTDRDIGEGKALRRFPEKGGGVRMLWHHAPRMTQSVMECQRKNADRHISFA